MGHPRKQKLAYEFPKKPYDKERLDTERKIRVEFGLRRKKEIWRAESIVRNFRRRARDLQAMPDEKKSKEMLQKLTTWGMPCTSLDEVLDITVKNILDRRLQTVVYKKGFAGTSRQARQLIVHGHVCIRGKRVTWPSYVVPIDEEKDIVVSPLVVRQPAHPITDSEES